MNPQSLIKACYVVPGLPHVLFAPDANPGWKRLRESYQAVQKEIQNSDAELILYFSTQWLSVIGYLFQADPNPKWTLTDHNWYELGSQEYEFKVDTGFADHYSEEVRALGHTVKKISYRGFPIDTGTVVANQILNPGNKISSAMASCNIYAEKQETLSIGQAAMRAIEKRGLKTIVVLVSGLSNRFHTERVSFAEDRISSAKDEEWNLKLVELLGEGRLEDVSEVGREFHRQANADMGFRGFWWLNGLCGKTNSFSGKVFSYAPIYGTGAAVVGLYPKTAIRSIPTWSNDESDLVERFQNSPQSVLKAPQTTPTKEQVAPQIETFAPSAGSSNINSEKAPLPVGPYPHAKRVGDFLFLSGVGPRQAGTTKIPGLELNQDGSIKSYDVKTQTRAVISNVQEILAAAGASFEDVIDVQVFLTNMKSDFKDFNLVYKEYFGGDHQPQPTRTTVEVLSLPTPIAVEFKVTAYKKQS